MKKILNLFLTFCLIGASVLNTYASESKALFVTDSKAGETGKIFVNGPANTDLTVVFVSPQGKRTARVVKTDKEGRVDTDYEAPKTAGRFEAYISGMQSKSTVYFDISPWQMPSTDESKISLSSKSGFADGEDVIEAKVIAKDEKGDAIQGLSVKLLCDDEGVTVDPTRQITNEHGYAVFTLASITEGTKTVYAYDAEGNSIANATVKFLGMEEDETVGTMQNQMYGMYQQYPTYGYPMMYPYPMAYGQQYGNDLTELQNLSAKLKSLEDVLGAVNTKTSKGGDYLGASLLDVRKVYAEGGSVDHFEITGLEEMEIELGEPVSFTVTALDADGELVEDYQGTVTFESTAEDTLLPSDYTFELADQGEHEFTLALTILSEGTQTLTVKDADDETIMGEFEIGEEGAEAVTKPVATIELDSPLAGTYASTAQTVSGTTQKDSTVTIYDGTTVLGSINTDDDGKFNFQVSGLKEGKHEIYIMSEHLPTGEITDSKKVEIAVDITPPVVSKISVTPTGEIEAETPFSITVESETESEISVVLNNLAYELTEQTKGVYTGQIMTPATEGQYAISILAKDKFGNDATYPGETKLTVKPKKKPVANVLAISEEEAIQVDWDIFPNAARYRVSYGTSQTSMTQKIVTIDSAPSWKIRNLEGGNDYFLQIEALSAAGQVISLPSEVASARALVKVVAVLPPVTGAAGTILTQPPTGGEVTQTGPELYFVPIASILFLDMYARIRRKLKASAF